MREPRGAPEGESRLGAVRTRLLPSEGSLIAACLREAKPSKIPCLGDPTLLPLPCARCTRERERERERDTVVGSPDPTPIFHLRRPPTRNPAWQKRVAVCMGLRLAKALWPFQSTPTPRLLLYSTRRCAASSRSTFPFWDATRPFLIPTAGKDPTRSVAVVCVD